MLSKKSCLWADFHQGPPPPPRNYYGVGVPPPYPSEAAQYPIPEYAGHVMMDTEPSQVNTRLATEQSESEEEDDVIVIHEHHHHHHHEDDQNNNGTNTSSNLLENILNDEVLYDFVSFLIEEAQSKNNEAVQPRRNGDDPDSSWKSYSESYRGYPESREEEEQVQIVTSYDTSQFLSDGFTPIVEVELDK